MFRAARPCRFVRQRPRHSRCGQQRCRLRRSRRRHRDRRCSMPVRRRGSWDRISGHRNLRFFVPRCRTRYFLPGRRCRCRCSIPRCSDLRCSDPCRSRTSKCRTWPRHRTQLRRRPQGGPSSSACPDAGSTLFYSEAARSTARPPSRSAISSSGSSSPMWKRHAGPSRRLEARLRVMVGVLGSARLS